MREFVLDASFALRWCFEDEVTPATEALLTTLQDQTAQAWVPGIWRYEVLNGLGKGIARGRLTREKAFLLWEELLALPIHTVEVPVDEKLLELSIRHNLAVYDASYLSLTISRVLPMASVDGKLQTITENLGFMVIKP